MSPDSKSLANIIFFDYCIAVFSSVRNKEKKKNENEKEKKKERTDEGRNVESLAKARASKIVLKYFGFFSIFSANVRDQSFPETGRSARSTGIRVTTECSNHRVGRDHQVRRRKRKKSRMTR